MRTVFTATAAALLFGLGTTATSLPALGQSGGGTEMGATHPLEVHPMRPGAQLYPEQQYPPARTGDYVTDYFTDTERDRFTGVERGRIDPRVRQAVQDAHRALAQGDRDEAERALQRADRFLGEGESARLERSIELAEGALDQGNVQGALQILREARATVGYQAAPTWQQPTQQQQWGTGAQRPWGATGQQQWGTGAQQQWGTTGQQPWGTTGQQQWGATAQQPFGTPGEPRWGGAAGQRP